MMTQTENFWLVPTARALRTVAIVSRHPDQHVLDTVMEAEDYDVVLIESLAQAYSYIKRLAPYMVVVCLEIDDLEGVQLLSLLNLDTDTARIPVVTYLTTPEADRFREERSEVDQESVRHLVAPSMN